MEPTPTATHAAPPAATPTVNESEKGIATVAYILTWLTGLIIFFVAKKEQRYARWNAVQAIGLGVVFVVLLIILQILGGVLVAGGGLAGLGVAGLLSTLVWLGTIVLVVICAIKAYQGTPLRLPVIADMADKYA